MSGEDRLDPDGVRNDGVPYYEADARRLQSYIDARAELSRFDAPVFVHAGNPHEYLYVASFDGTGNDKLKDPEHETNIGKIDDQIKGLMKAGGEQIRGSYVAGPGTEANFIERTFDGMDGHTYGARIEEQYKLFIDQAWRWKQADPAAAISVADIGFSRGGEQAAGFARIVQERGIQDPMGAHYTYDSHHRITHVEYTRPPLVEPGQVAQAVGLFDPVGTGDPVKHHDRRLPPSVISGFQIIATDERRGLFKSDHIIDPGMTADGRFLGVTVAGAHSDVGGSYHRDGLAIRSENLMVDYLNGLSDQPFLGHQAEPDDPRLDVVHRSEDGTLLYRLAPKVDRLAPGGYNELLVPRSEATRVADPFNAEPRDESLNRQFERQRIDTGVRPAIPDQPERAPSGDLSSRLDRLLAAGQADDWGAFGRENQGLAFGEAGRGMLARATAQADWLEQQAVQQMARQQLVQQPGAVMSL
ncbi:phospholipase effector Tle1 domain-containing protein [Rhodanobacter geophilus]|uniref:DUF2235 domain-containing protein n=1 Tax=Rhodanobacter geophilus TaxID=3162488 RepID=A0ABV3QSI4_9GAMM